MTSKEDSMPEMIDVELVLLKGQRLELTDGISLVVVSAGGGKTRLGIDAPAEVMILRAELKSDTKECT